MGRSTVHYTDNKTNNSLKKLHKLLRPAGTPVQRVEYIIELLLLRIFEVKLRRDGEFAILRQLFIGEEEQKRLFTYLKTIDSSSITSVLNAIHFPFYGNIVTEVGKKIKNTELSPKVMDELVLIQSVFSNSNFTNNVIGGNLQEVISEVSGIDEATLVKTDLLGDAIESALSETGGTKDIGLYRTPDHIRQFMVGLVEPTVNDLIMDPACGTGGFLFDSYEYALARFDGEDAEYPGEKAHPELRKWFKEHFSKINEEYPDDIQSQNFYRHGVFGIEYLGMIKKMASVNLYIRGLNPRNIEQGDALNKYGTSIMPDSKTVILANPPFGAETDQTSYPNVWEDFSTEKETTILFVKLMLDSLRDNGRCAVIVSEGFLTWDQTSAKILREKLLNEANLKAVIGLPQGVFVSKSGVGPKTSILLFEKGSPTTKTWFYQVNNDGYTMGTNRKPKSNSQLVDALEIYHTYIKNGLIPPEKQNSFVIDSNWIKSLDPRVKKRIREEVEEANGIKQQNDIEKKTSALFRKVELKQISEKEMKFELNQVEELWENKIDAEIEQKISKAYSFSYNYAAYHSALNKTQLKEWKKLIGNIEPEDIDTLDNRYIELYTSELESAFSILSKFNLSNSIEADIVREYVSNYVSKETLEHYPKLKKIDEIFKMGAKYPMVKLEPYLTQNTEKIKPNQFSDIRWRTLGVSNQIGVFINEDAKPEETNQSYYRVNKNEFCYNPYRVNVGSIGINGFDYDNQIISGAYVVFAVKEDELLPQYLDILIKSKQFNDYVISKANVGSGVRMNFTFEDICNWEIPLPDIDEQYKVVEKIEKLLNASKGFELIDKNLDLSFHNVKEWISISDILNKDDSQTLARGKSPRYEDDTEYIILNQKCNRGLYIDRQFAKTVSKKWYKNIPNEVFTKENDILVNSTGEGTVGRACIIDKKNVGLIYDTHLLLLRMNEKIYNPKLAVYYLSSDEGQKQMLSKLGAQSTKQVELGTEKLSEILLPNLTEEETIKIVNYGDKISYIKEINKDFLIRTEDEINKIIKEIWGEEDL